MKQKFFTTITEQGRRMTPIALAFVLLTWLGATSGDAQSKNQKHVTSVRLGKANEGSRVTVVSDSALNDYEAYRRGDRFYVKIPAADFASGVPNIRAAEFEDVQVQKAADSSIISFRLQPGTAARVDQRSNRLIVVFSTRGRSENSSGASSSVTVGAGRTGIAGPASWKDNRRDGRDSSDSNPGRNDSATSLRAPPPQQPSAGLHASSSGTTHQEDPTPSSHGSTEIATGSTSVATNTPASLRAPVSAGQPLSSSAATTPGATSSQSAPARGVFLTQWVTQHWLTVLIGALLLGGLAFVLFRRFETSRQFPESVFRPAIKGTSIETPAPRAAESTSRAAESTSRATESTYSSPVSQAYKRKSLQKPSLYKTLGEVPVTETLNPKYPAPFSAALFPPASMEDGFGPEEAPLRLQEEALIRAAEELDARRPETEALRKKTEGEAQPKSANEEGIRAEVEARLRAEEQRLQWEANERRRVAEERLKVAEELLKVEQEVLRQVAAELTRRRAEVEEARRRAEEESRPLT
ncbi:MAG: hypothetical protein ACR2IB_10135 [Pyrinomonadaceae bacterium]